MATVCIDFDGTLHNPYDREPGYKMGKPIPGAVEALRRLKLNHHTIVVCTARADVGHVRKWLAFFGMSRYVQTVTHEKPRADLYVDDKGFHFQGSWHDMVVPAINSRLAHDAADPRT